MKEKSGITLITLAITIVLMLILIGVSVSVGTESVRNAKLTQFNAELRIIHTRVNELLEEMSVAEIGSMLTGAGYTYTIPNGKTSAATTATGNSNLEGYWYFNKTGLEKIGVAGIDREVVINFSSRDVVDLDGITQNGVTVYRSTSWENENYTGPENNQSANIPSFSLSQKTYGLNATIKVINLSYGNSVSKGTISYCLLNQNGQEGTWKQVTGTEIPVSVSGIYKVKATNSANQSSTSTIEVTLVNKPNLDSGMVPVIYKEATGNETEGHWEIADENGGDWFDYSPDSAKWANVMLLDGLTVEGTNGNITVTSANKADMVGKKVTTLGSMFVWIPRYMYKIPYQNFNTSNAAEIEIKFLKGTTNIATDNTNEAASNPYAEGILLPTANNNPWIVHPAFIDGSKTNYSHGGWDSEITGIWVAKFEASSSTPNATNGGGNTTALGVKVLPNVVSWRSISVNNMYEVCISMPNMGNIYGLSSNSNSHMMKNTEWGAVAYLTQSQYGQVRTGANGIVWNNPNSSYMTGQAGTGANATNSSTTYNYNTENGQKASTTGNVYGIYDLAGGAWEYLAAYVETGEATSSNTNRGTLVSVNEKYVDRYHVSSPDATSTNNYNDLYDSANSKLLKWGDALYETSTGAQAWQQDRAVYPFGTYIVFTRGGAISDSVEAGLFSYTGHGAGGEARTTIGFRPVLITQ